MRPARVLSLWGPVAAVVALLYAASSQPGSSVPQIVWDKLVHAAAYALLGSLAIRAFHGGFGALRVVPAAAATAFTVAHGAFDEFHQSFVPGRDASAADLAADAAGAAVALIAAWAWARRHRENT